MNEVTVRLEKTQAVDTHPLAALICSRYIKFLDWLAPLGYEDENGFHYGEPKPYAA